MSFIHMSYPASLDLFVIGVAYAIHTPAMRNIRHYTRVYNDICYCIRMILSCVCFSQMGVS